MVPDIAKKVAALGVGCLFACLVAECTLRVYNPIEVRVRGSEITLPVNKRHVFFHEIEGAKVDSRVEVTRNGLGFRGPPPPKEFEDSLTIVAVGGSTTECVANTDGKDWPAVLGTSLQEHFPGIWVNNAGLDGHSTFGHLMLLDQVLGDLKPDYALFLVGVNDVERKDLNIFDERIIADNQNLRDRIFSYSELLSTVQTIVRSLRAVELELDHHWELDLKTEPRMEMSPEQRNTAIASNRSDHLPSYAERVRKLVQGSRKAGIEPILITQPALWGDVVDPTTGEAMGNIRHADRNAASRWEILQLYNDATRRVASEEGTLVIDLANQLPKDSRYYYDWIHYSNEGSAKVAEVVESGLIPFLRDREG